jgi:CheY-like chemotaxis protein
LYFSKDFKKSFSLNQLMAHYSAIFLVDDDPINNLINRRLLGKVDISKNILEFQDGEDALAEIELLSKDDGILILLDINMPVMNGWEFLEKYLTFFPFRKDRIVILSSSIDFFDRQKAKEFEIVCAFLEKPLTLDKIQEIENQ